jgi:hypothetical protein
MEGVVGMGLCRSRQAIKHGSTNKSAREKAKTRDVSALQKKADMARKARKGVHWRRMLEDTIHEDATEENATEENAMEENAMEENAMEENAMEENAIEENAIEENAIEEDKADALDESEVDDCAVADDGLGGGDGPVEAAWGEPCDGDVAVEDAGLLQELATELGAASVDASVGCGDAREL